jgi:histidyl-tRNA synthetase
MEDLGMLPATRGSTEVFVTVFDGVTRAASLRAAASLRDAGVATQVWLEAPGKLGRQLKHADRVGARWAVVIGPEEVRDGMVVVRDLAAGTQIRSGLDVVSAVRAAGAANSP